VSRAVEDAQAEVRDLRWSVSDDNPARRELLGAAAVDATHRADAYAEALGLRRGTVEDVSDLPLTASSGFQPEQAMSRHARRGPIRRSR